MNISANLAYKLKTHVSYSITFFSKIVYEIM